MNWLRRLIVALALLTVLAGPAAPSAMACPMCKAANESDDPQPFAYMVSILFMLGMVGGVFTTVTVFMVRLGHREAAAMATSGLSDQDFTS